MGMVAGGLSLAGGLAGMFGGGSKASDVQSPQGYQYMNQWGADNNAYSGTGNLSQYNVAGQNLPQYQQLAQGMVNNPYAGQYQQGAGQAGQVGQQSGMNAYNAGGQLTSGALSAMPGVEQMLSMGFDPQNAMYAKMQQQNQDQANAQNSMSGLGSTPYGAGVANQANQNFNLGWENTALQRAQMGAQGAGSLLGQIGQTTNTGQGLQAGAAGQMLAGSGMAYNTAQGIGANQLNALNQSAQMGQMASQIPQQQIADYLQYLQQGTGQQNANTSLFNAQLSQQNQGFNQNQQLGRGMGQGLGMMGQSMGFGQGGSNWGNMFGGWGGNAGNAGGTGLGGFGGLY